MTLAKPIRRTNGNDGPPIPAGMTCGRVYTQKGASRCFVPTAAQASRRHHSDFASRAVRRLDRAPVRQLNPDLSWGVGSNRVVRHSRSGLW